ncbi:hypothetical protein [Mycobacterium sp. 141]|uniref:hypothetical protein n=1 Tax=Mycobacterium sp. 141 TaxID=1120797 RepID=UPI00037DAD75|nr:hypothetical protein [Mycobacterium sp. 141]
MGVVGADSDQMRALARTLHQAADRLEAASAAVTGSLPSVPWRGPDAERYRSQWHVERNAGQQEHASDATGSTTAKSMLQVLPNGLDQQPLNPLMGIRDFLNSNAVWPITWGTLLGRYDDVGAIPLVDALGLASDNRLTPEQKIGEAGDSMVDLASGLIKGTDAPVGYLSGVAVSQWRDVAEQAAQADFSAGGVKTVTAYIASDPGGAFDAAKDAVVGYVPKLFSNLVPW